MCPYLKCAVYSSFPAQTAYDRYWDAFIQTRRSLTLVFGPSAALSPGVSRQQQRHQQSQDNTHAHSLLAIRLIAQDFASFAWDSFSGLRTAYANTPTFSSCLINH